MPSPRSSFKKKRRGLRAILVVRRVISLSIVQIVSAGTMALATMAILQEAAASEVVEDAFLSEEVAGLVAGTPIIKPLAHAQDA